MSAHLWICRESFIEEEDMPWEIVRKGSKYCVQKIGTGEISGCHENKLDAVSQQRALYSTLSGEKKEKR